MPYRIIIAEDDVDFRTVLARLIQQIYPTATIMTAADGVDALDLYDRDGADLVLTDRIMPYVDGPALIRLLRARSATLPIIAIAGSPSAQADMLAAGANVFLTKLDAVNQLGTLLPTLLPVP